MLVRGTRPIIVENVSSTMQTSPGKNPEGQEKSKREDPAIQPFHLSQIFHQLTAKISQASPDQKHHPAEPQNQGQIYDHCFFH